MMHFSKSYHWVDTFLWVGIVITLACLGYSVFYEPYYWSLTIVAVLLALFIILGYIKYTRVLEMKHKFVVVQETFTTVMLVYFSYYYFMGSKQIPDSNMINDARQKFDDMYEKTRYHLTMPLMLTAVKTFGEIKNIKDIIKHEVKNFSGTDGFNLDNAKIITTELGNLFNKIRKLSEIVSQGFSSKKSLNDILSDDVDATISEAKSSVKNKARDIRMDISDTAQKTKAAASKVKNRVGKTVNQTQKNIKRKMS